MCESGHSVPGEVTGGQILDPGSFRCRPLRFGSPSIPVLRATDSLAPKISQLIALNSSCSLVVRACTYCVGVEARKSIGEFVDGTLWTKILFLVQPLECGSNH